MLRSLAKILYVFSISAETRSRMNLADCAAESLCEKSCESDSLNLESPFHLVRNAGKELKFSAVLKLACELGRPLIVDQTSSSSLLSDPADFRLFVLSIFEKHPT